MSHYVSENVAELVAYINRISLGQPPDHQHVHNANGGDGPENVHPRLATRCIRDSLHSVQ